MTAAVPLPVPGPDREVLLTWLRPGPIPPGMAQRARIVLMAGDGVPNTTIARRVGVSRPTVLHWRRRYLDGGLAALRDRPRSGRPREVDEIDVVTATLADGGRPPARLGVPYWSARLLAAETGISFTTVARIWRTWGVRPGPDGPGLGPGDVLGLRLHPSGNAVVLRAGPPVPGPGGQAAGSGGLAAGSGGPAAGTADPGCDRHGLPAFLVRAAAAQPHGSLHLVCDNDSHERHPAVRAWLERRPRITAHVTRSVSGWWDLVGLLAGHDPGGTAGDLTGIVRRSGEPGDADRESFTWFPDTGVAVVETPVKRLQIRTAEV